MSVRLYSYVSPKWIAEQLALQPIGFLISTPDDIRSWIKQTNQSLTDNIVIATFIIDALGNLRIAERHSEHFVCAGGQPVQSAGEITFQIDSDIEIIEVSNQSTGYCPEPKSWSSVVLTLEKIGLKPPPDFIPDFMFTFEFRRCVHCRSLNLVKEIFVCSICDLPLSHTYNVQ